MSRPNSFVGSRMRDGTVTLDLGSQDLRPSGRITLMAGTTGTTEDGVMGLLDKVKVQAGQIAEKAQQGVAQGKDRLEEMQANKRGEALLHDLGAAYYAQQRHDGPAEAVQTALAAMDAHVVLHGEPDAEASAEGSAGD